MLIISLCRFISEIFLPIFDTLSTTDDEIRNGISNNNKVSAVGKMAHGSEMKWNLCLRVIAVAGLR